MRLTAREVAEAVGLKPTQVQTARRAGQLPAHRTGVRHWYFEPADVKRWWAENAQRYSPPRSPVSPNPTASPPGDAGDGDPSEPPDEKV